ncbi:hypothetical protein OUZ56_006388 [Daphnia magna]|uniref:Uncharacterized protein n=1 Tax=Daphnia magna TaxID=35525 RepID=A0ABQ9YVJ0_9CRUS|nr:hypothetical protein OUZ56_006388 [Daphnia magna]
MLSFPGRHPSTKPWVTDDIHSWHDCVVKWYHFYKAKQNYDASLLHWTADLDHVSTERLWITGYIVVIINRRSGVVLVVHPHESELVELNRFMLMIHVIVTVYD